MPTITAQADGNWSNPATWTGGSVPGDGDTADLNGHTVTMDITTVPASGTLAGLVSPGTAGRLSLDMGGATNYTINADVITAGTKSGGLLYVTGAAASGTLTINGDVTGGSGASAYGFLTSSTGDHVINGNVAGGSGSASHGAYLNTTTGTLEINGDVAGGSGSGNGVFHYGAVTVTGNVTGGSGAGAYGVRVVTPGASLEVVGNVQAGTYLNNWGVYNSGAGTVTITGNLINGAVEVAYAGGPFTWNAAADHYIDLTGGQRAAAEVDEDDLIEGVQNGQVTGVYHEATVAEVQDGVMFGPNQSLEGAYKAVIVIED